MLQVRQPRHRHAHGPLGKFDERARQPRRVASRLARRILYEQAEIGSHQLVAAARGVQLESQRAQPLNKRHFDEVMHVFGRRSVEPCRLSRGFAGNLVERRERALALRRGEDACPPKPLRPGAIDRQFVRQQPPVEGKRPLEFVEQLVRRPVEPATPQLALIRGCRVRAHGFLAAAGSAELVETEVCPATPAVCVTGKANKLMKPSASLGWKCAMLKLARSVRYSE